MRLPSSMVISWVVRSDAKAHHGYRCPWSDQGHGASRPERHWIARPPFMKLGARPLEGRGFFVINGVSWMILDVLVPIRFCLMWFLRPLTPYSGAYFQKQAFCLDETTIFEVFEKSQTNSTWHVSMWFLRPLTPYSGAYFQKQAFRLDETTIFGVCENSQSIQPDMFWFLCCDQPTLRVLPRTFADLDCLRYNASTTWTHGKFQKTYNSVAWRMSGKFQRTYSNVAWRMSGKLQRTYNSVAWRMSGKFQRTYREACPSSVSSHECYYMPHPTTPHPCIHAPTGSHREACPSSASSHERYYMPHSTPPHPCIHAPTGSHRQACPSSASSHERYYMPHPAPPRPTPPVHTCTYRQPQRSMSFLGKFTWTLLHALLLQCAIMLLQCAIMYWKLVKR